MIPIRGEESSLEADRVETTSAPERREPGAGATGAGGRRGGSHGHAFAGAGAAGTAGALLAGG